MCPACNGKRLKEFKAHASIRVSIQECRRCGCIFGSCYLGDSYAIVKPWLTAQTDDMEVVPFDFTCVGSQGVTRRHGWFDKKSGYMVQVG
jgi:hypothetical protein